MTTSPEKLHDLILLRRSHQSALIAALKRRATAENDARAAENDIRTVRAQIEAVLKEFASMDNDKLLALLDSMIPHSAPTYEGRPQPVQAPTPPKPSVPMAIPPPMYPLAAPTI